MTDAPRCGNCKHWKRHDYPNGSAMGDCVAPCDIDWLDVPSCISSERMDMHENEGGDCDLHAPKEPDK